MWSTLHRLKAIATRLGVLVIVVHHYGKAETSGLRGASAWKGGCDVVMSVLAKRNEITGEVSDRELALRVVHLQAVRKAFERTYPADETDPKKRTGAVRKAFNRGLRATSSEFSTQFPRRRRMDLEPYSARGR